MFLVIKCRQEKHVKTCFKFHASKVRFWINLNRNARNEIDEIQGCKRTEGGFRRKGFAFFKFILNKSSIAWFGNGSFL